MSLIGLRSTSGSTVTPFRMDRGKIKSYSRYLDLRTGELHRYIHWTPEGGAPVLLHFCRLTHLADPHALAVRLAVTPLEQAVRVRVRARIDGHVDNEGSAPLERF
jgi:hypothetical glycosyl hydrolase